MKILAVNPGGTSTKIAIYDEEVKLFSKTVRHTTKEMLKYDTIYLQYEYRLELVLNALDEFGFDIKNLSAVVGRGGLLKPILGGVYEVNDAIISDIKEARNGEHACNLGCVIAKEIANMAGTKAFIVDPVSVDEFEDEARITGISDLEKKSWLHALNHKAVARKVCKEKDWKYENVNLIVAHLGSGISIVPHKKGRMIDGSGGRSDGPFSPCRSGGLPSYQLIQLCYSGKYSNKEMVDLITDFGGMYSYLKTNDMIEIENKYGKDNEVTKIVDAFVYQVMKEIGCYVPVLDGDVHSIILTGGIANAKKIMTLLQKRIEYIAPVEIVPGEEELEALVFGVLRVLKGEEVAKNYI